MQTTLFIGTPCFGGVVTQRYMQCMFALLQSLNGQNIPCHLELLGNESLIPRGRNSLVSAFLDNPANTRLLFVDADIGFEPGQVMRFVDSGLDVVAGMYPLKLIEWNSESVKRALSGESPAMAPLRFVGAPDPDASARATNGFVPALYAGTGFMMIKREVIEKMISRYPESRYTAAHTAAVPSKSPNQYALFDCMISPHTSEYLSEDYAFCERWRAIGGEVWLDTEGTLMHVGPYEFVGTPKGRF